jgi:hypothetical protein
VPFVGPTPPAQAPCNATDVTASATTRPIRHGVAGIVRLKGDHCSIDSKAGPDELRSGDTALGVRAIPWNQQSDPVAVPGYEFPLAAGNAVWSFTWTGSWCGSHATSIVMPLTNSHGDVVAPLAGPHPACAAGPTTTPSILRAGAPGIPGQPDLPAPAEWSGLRAKLHLPKVLHSAKLPHLAVRLRNITGHDIVLAPCPAYAIVAFNRRGEGGTAKGYGSSFPCPGHPRVIPAHGAPIVAIPASHYSRRLVAPHGGHVKVTFAIRDVPPASAHARVAP